MTYRDSVTSLALTDSFKKSQCVDNLSVVSAISDNPHNLDKSDSK